MHQPLSRRTLVAGLAAVPAALVIPAQRAAAETAGQGGLVVRSAAPHAALTAAFTAYGNSGRGWTGADSAYSLPLTGARELWMFSDTFLGTVNADGSRDPDTPIVNNTFVVQRHGDMRTVHGGTSEDPEAILTPPTHPQSWYWLGGSYLGAGALNVMFLRFQRTGPGMWDWVWKENVLGRFTTGDLRLIRTYPMPSTKVQWASWLERHGAHTYVYGVEDLGLTKYMHVARVRGDDLRRPWEFFDGTGWSSDGNDSARVMQGVANEYSVTRWHGRYLLVTHDTNQLFSNEIVAYVGDSPTGPFTGRTLLYTTPETGLFGSYGDPDVITYNSHEHPELRRGDRLVVTYNVNSLDFTDVLDDVTKYRPRFVEVRLGL